MVVVAVVVVVVVVVVVNVDVNVNVNVNADTCVGNNAEQQPPQHQMLSNHLSKQVSNLGLLSFYFL